MEPSPSGRDRATPAVEPARQPPGVPPANDLVAMVVTRLRVEQTARTLLRIAEQTRPPSFLLVVNVEADPRTEALVRAWSPPSTQVEYHAVFDNVGPAGAVAAGLPILLDRCPTARYLALLEDDDPPPAPDTLGRLVDHLERQPASTRLGGVALHGAVLDRSSALLRRPELGAEGSADVDYLAGGSCPVLRRDMVESVGAYDPLLFFGFEELDYGLRARRAGWRLQIIAGWEGPPMASGTTARARLGPWTWRRYYSLRNLMVVLVRDGHRAAAVRVAMVRGILKPLGWLPRHPRLAATHLRHNIVAIVDACTGRLGRRLPPHDDPPAG